MSPEQVNKTIEDYYKLIRFICYRYNGYHVAMNNQVSPDDLVNNAVLRLIKLLPNFDETKSKIKTYISNQVRYSIQDYLREIDHLSRLDRKRVNDGENTDVTILSIDAERQEEFSNICFNDGIEDKKLLPVDNDLESQENFDNLIRGLSESAKAVMKMYYIEEKTMYKIGKSLGLSESRISQIHSQAIAQLKRQWSNRYDEVGCC